MKCDRCHQRVSERFQCGSEWLCGPCMPRDRVAMYAGWNPKAEQRQETQKK